MKPEITLLNNGLRIVSLNYPQFETVSLGAWINTGSACETIEQNGISHFLEHMVFKGTKTRSSFDISDEIENVGGQSNAYTSREMTAYYAKMLKEDAELALDVICDMINNPTFANDELIKEREVVVQEIKQTYDDPSDIVFDYLQDKAFSNQAMGRAILGTKELVRSFGAKELNSYMKSNYAANNTTICAVGNIEHEKLVKMAEKRMLNYNQKTNFVADKQTYTGGYFAEGRDVEQAQVALAFEGVGYNNSNYHHQILLSSILGGGMSSRLFREIRENRGLAYSVYSFPSFYSTSGYLGISVGTEKSEINNMLPVIADELKKLSNDLVCEQELSRAKAQIKSSMLMSLESSSSVCEKLARQTLLFNRIIPINETVEKINSTSLEDIKNISQQIFSSKPTYSLVGNINGHLEYNKLCDLLK